jgi:ssDNA-binding Zn-finger/Zn-ribbon topoisomerase 1
MSETKRVGDLRIPFVNDALVETGFQKLLSGPDPVAQAVTLERKGGPCPYCGVAFVQIDVDNRFGKFSYFQPGCRCFPVCKKVQLPHGTTEGCGRFLITEKLSGIDYCTQCYADPPGTKARAVRSGARSSRKASGKDAAAGDRDE